MTLQQLTILAALDDARQFHLAAARLHLSQPALSMQLARLERELGAMLFDRSRQPIVPTKTGEKVIERARAVLREARLVEEAVRLEENGRQGHVRLGIIPTVSASLLPLLLANFQKNVPGLSLEFHEDTTDHLVDALRRDRLDALILAYGAAENLEEIILYDEAFLVYLNPSHPAVKKESLQLSSLNPADALLLAEGHCLRDQAVSLCSRMHKMKNKIKTDEKPPQFQFACGSLETMVRLVDQDLGFTLLPHLTAQNLPKSAKNRLKTIEPSGAGRRIVLASLKPGLMRQRLDVIAGEIKSAVKRSLSSL